ncbi:MAG: sigma-70 family RNA polymerase sigma factor [Verrucomicrobiales bacterium]|nr:sigma-70 family RNA polymerase sigma factor [Verrucomicrobiales bacterium]
MGDPPRNPASQLLLKVIGFSLVSSPVPPTDSRDEAWFADQAASNAGQFRTTLWTVVLAAADRSSPDSEAALAKLCQTYWLPVYAFIRKRGRSPEQAQDLTQSFFAKFLEMNYVARAERERGRFRSFLMTSVENFLHDEHDRASTRKRGGGQWPLSLDAKLAEEEFLNEPAEALTPASAFEKHWARTLLENVMRRLAEEYRESGKFDLFGQLQAHLWGDSDSIPYEDLSQRMAMTVVNLRVTAHRMRQRYREILRQEIAHTVTSPDEIDGEIRYLIQVVSG